MSNFFYKLAVEGGESPGSAGSFLEDPAPPALPPAQPTQPKQQPSAWYKPWLFTGLTTLAGGAGGALIPMFAMPDESPYKKHGITLGALLGALLGAGGGYAAFFPKKAAKEEEEEKEKEKPSSPGIKPWLYAGLETLAGGSAAALTTGLILHALNDPLAISRAGLAGGVAAGILAPHAMEKYFPKKEQQEGEQKTSPRLRSSSVSPVINEELDRELEQYERALTSPKKSVKKKTKKADFFKFAEPEPGRHRYIPYVIGGEGDLKRKPYFYPYNPQIAPTPNPIPFTPGPYSQGPFYTPRPYDPGPFFTPGPYHPGPFFTPRPYAPGQGGAPSTPQQVPPNPGNQSGGNWPNDMIRGFSRVSSNLQNMPKEQRQQLLRGDPEAVRSYEGLFRASGSTVDKALRRRLGR